MSSSDSKSTVDLKEVDFFDSNPGWNDKSSLFRLNAIRVPFVKDGILSRNIRSKDKDVFNGLKILDVGCGVGYLAEALSELGADITGLDASPERITTAKNHAAKNRTTEKIRYVVSTIEEHMKDHKDFYDVVVASEVVEHVGNHELFIESCVAVLKPGGSIFITTHAKNIFSWLYVIILAENVFKAIPKGTHTYDKFISPIELRKILAKYDCRTTQVRGMLVNLLTCSWSFISYDGISYALHAVKNSQSLKIKNDELLSSGIA